MANLQLTPQWTDGVYQWETDDPVEGGPNGIDNKPTRDLGDRSEFLKQQMDQAVGGDVAGQDGFSLKMLGGYAGYVNGIGRDLRKVLGVSSIAEVMAALRERCNGTGLPDFYGLMIGDYLDGIDLSGIAASVANIAGQAWNATYKNNRIVIAAFNPYKGVGDTEVTKNHILFAFANVPLRARMNPSNINAGGYTASEMRVFLDGANGDGTGAFTYGTAPENPVVPGAFLAALTAQIGDYIIPVRKMLDESVFGGTQTFWWRTYRLFLQSENDVFGANAWGRPEYGDGQKLHIPLYRDSYAYRIKRYNGSRDWWWLNTPSANSAANFGSIISNGNVSYYSAADVVGCAPAFCVA